MHLNRQIRKLRRKYQQYWFKTIRTSTLNQFQHKKIQNTDSEHNQLDKIQAAHEQDRKSNRNKEIAEIRRRILNSRWSKNEWFWIPLDEAPPLRCSPEKLSQSAFHRLILA